MSAVRRHGSQILPMPAVVGERELTRRRLLRALDERKRYRYVRPEVTTTEDGWLITSPCCSRNVDPSGGVIDIARLTRSNGKWQLYARDESREHWVMRLEAVRFDEAMAMLCADEEREFWP